MTMCEELHGLLADVDLPHPERMRRIQELTGVQGCIIRALSDALADHDWDVFEMYLWAAFHHPEPSMTLVLCEALRLKSRSVPNEDILQVLARCS